ncbi:MAG: hypothetical protein ACYC35_00610 [Pirellulales bacterium]
MAYEQFANGGLSSLAAGIDDSVGSLTVKSAVGFPTIGNFRIIIGTEIMLVTNVQGQTFTVTRAQEGTSAASHDADAAVFHTLTAGSLALRDIQQFATGAIASRDAAGQAGRLYLPTDGFVSQDNGSLWNMMPLNRMTPPASTDFTWVNQGSATVADTKGTMVLSTPSSTSTDSLRLLVKSAPTPPYEITVCILPQSPIYTSAATIAQYGICWRDSASSKIITFGWGMNNYPVTFSYDQWTNHTTLSANQYQRTAPIAAPMWIRFSDDGTNRLVKVSSDGFNYENASAAQGRTVFLTADQVGVFANSWKTANGIQRVISFLHWSQS